MTICVPWLFFRTAACRVFNSFVLFRFLYILSIFVYSFILQLGNSLGFGLAQGKVQGRQEEIGIGKGWAGMALNVVYYV